MSLIYRAVLVCPDPCPYCRETRDGGRIVLDQRTFHSRENARQFGRSLAGKVYGSEHRVEVEQATAPVWSLTSSEPTVTGTPSVLRIMQPRWASVSKREWPATGQYRHLVRRGHHTSACGTTALPASIWRGNSTKPPCPECLRRQEERP